MKKGIVVFLLLWILLYPTSLSYSERHYNQLIKIENNDNINIINQEKENSCEYYVSEITGWDIDLAKYFVTEAENRNISVFDEALPIIAVETREDQFSFDLVNYNSNGTSDKGLFQINDITYKDIVKLLKKENREFDSWDRLNPKFSIAAGLCWLGYLKNTYGLENHALFTSFNRGVTGAKIYARKTGTYETCYSREVIEEANKIHILLKNTEKNTTNY